ncbi:MAG: 4-hydroxy-tetrahydrodipicolinate reductase [Lachnospiraceae bacterium]|nr:4-hydroxy-tetrahydrodipicolinate reductase [Lachnospiraceae bacterium]
MTRLMMHGCNGAMGQVISNIVAEMDGVEIAAGVDAVDNRNNGYPVFTNIDDCNVEIDAIVDFSAAPAVDHLLEYAVRTKTPVVLCTTGLSEEQLKKAEEASKEVAVLRSANMSLGINTLMKLLKEAASVLAPAGFDIDIVEKHHRKKVDAPSGTALALADSINEAMGNEYEYVYDRSGRRIQRPKKEIGLSAVRGGTIVGEHEVIFAGTDEVIELKHTAYSKAVFGKGAVEAAVFLAGKPAGLYNMSHVIG